MLTFFCKSWNPGSIGSSSWNLPIRN